MTSVDVNVNQFEMEPGFQFDSLLDFDRRRLVPLEEAGSCFAFLPQLIYRAVMKFCGAVAWFVVITAVTERKKNKKQIRQ